GQNAVVCNGDTPNNSCGGCNTLAATEGDECGQCGGGTWTCQGTEQLVCNGASPVNACGGCGTLFGIPGAPCGPCFEREWTCNPNTGNVTCSQLKGRPDECP